MDLYNIHLGYNAFTNIIEYAIGYKPDLQYSYIILNHFPEGNDSFKKAGSFLTDFATKENHLPIVSLIENTTEENAAILSYLCLASCYKGDIENWKYFDQLERSNKQKYFITKIWTYPMRWDSHHILKNASAFVLEYDKVLQTENKLSKSELLLYDLFKLELSYESSNNQEELLHGLQKLILENKGYFSLTNFNKYVQEYFPNYNVPIAFKPSKKDSYDVEWQNNNSIYNQYKSSYNSLSESVNALKSNPYDPNVATYTNVKKWIHKENYATTIKALDFLNELELVHTKTCRIPALSFDLIKIITETNNWKLTNSQNSELKTRFFKKWLDFHIKCNITMLFYMDNSVISIWDNLSKKEQDVLVKYFQEELIKSDNPNYWKAMQKVLKIKQK